MRQETGTRDACDPLGHALTPILQVWSNGERKFMARNKTFSKRSEKGPTTNPPEKCRPQVRTHNLRMIATRTTNASSACTAVGVNVRSWARRSDNFPDPFELWKAREAFHQQQQRAREARKEARKAHKLRQAQRLLPRSAHDSKPLQPDPSPKPSSLVACRDSEGVLAPQRPAGAPATCNTHPAGMSDIWPAGTPLKISTQTFKDLFRTCYAPVPVSDEDATALALEEPRATTAACEHQTPEGGAPAAHQGGNHARHPPAAPPTTKAQEALASLLTAPALLPREGKVDGPPSACTRAPLAVGGEVEESKVSSEHEWVWGGGLWNTVLGSEASLDMSTHSNEEPEEWKRGTASKVRFAEVMKGQQTRCDGGTASKVRFAEVMIEEQRRSTSLSKLIRAGVIDTATSLNMHQDFLSCFNAHSHPRSLRPPRQEASLAERAARREPKSQQPSTPHVSVHPPLAPPLQAQPPLTSHPPAHEALTPRNALTTGGEESEAVGARGRARGRVRHARESEVLPATGTRSPRSLASSRSCRSSLSLSDTRERLHELTGTGLRLEVRKLNEEVRKLSLCLAACTPRACTILRSSSLSSPSSCAEGSERVSGGSGGEEYAKQAASAGTCLASVNKSGGGHTTPSPCASMVLKPDRSTAKRNLERALAEAGNGNDIEAHGEGKETRGANGQEPLDWRIAAAVYRRLSRQDRRLKSSTHGPDQSTSRM
jgi:hypothetical protein